MGVNWPLVGRSAELDRLRPRADGKPYREQITYVADRPGHDQRYAIDAGKIGRLVGYYAYAAAAQSGKTHHNVFGKVFVHLKKSVGINHLLNHLADIVRLVGVFRNNGIQ